MNPRNDPYADVLPPCSSWGVCDHATQLLKRTIEHQCRDRSAHQVHHCIYCGETVQPLDLDQVVDAGGAWS